MSSIWHTCVGAFLGKPIVPVHIIECMWFIHLSTRYAIALVLLGAQGQCGVNLPGLCERMEMQWGLGGLCIEWVCGYVVSLSAFFGPPRQGGVCG